MSWLSSRWNEEWRAAEHSRLHSFINTPDHVPGQDLPRRQWTTYNRIRTGVGRFGEAMKRWGLKSTSECECCAPNQHIMDDCTMHRQPNGERGLTDLDEDTRIWVKSAQFLYATFTRKIFGCTNDLDVHGGLQTMYFKKNMSSGCS